MTNLLKKLRSFKAKLIASISVSILVLGIALVMPLSPNPTFYASARIWIQQKNTQASSEKAGNLVQSFMTYFNSPIVTACEVFRSTRVLSEAVSGLSKKLPKDQIPSVSMLEGAFTAEPVPGTDIISVRFNYPNGYVATCTVQAVIDAFMKLQANQASYSSAQSKAFLTEQLVEAKNQLQKMGEQIKNYHSNNNVSDPEQETADVLHRRTTVETDLREAQEKLKEDDERISYLQQGLAPKDSDTKPPDEAQQQIAADARKKLVDLKTQYSELSTIYRPEHPRMRQLSAMMERLQKTADTGSMTLASGNTSESMSSQLEEAKADQLTQRSRVAMLQPQLSVLEGQLRYLPAKQIELTNLVRAQKVVADRVSELETELNSAKFIQAVDSRNDSFQVIDPPSVNRVTVISRRPKLLGIAALALFMGVATFVALELLDPRLRRISTLLNVLPVPIIGWLPDLSAINWHSMEPIHRLRLGLRTWLSEGSTQIVITSSELDEGQGLLASSLAMSLSQSGRKVLLIDTDNLHPSLHQSFPDQPVVPGLSEFLSHPHNNVWASIVRPVADNLKLITAGGVSRSASLLSSDKVPLLMEKAKAEADVVIYNTAPTGESAAALALLSPQVYLLILASLNHTHVPSLKLLSTQLKPHVCRGSGLVLANANDYAVVAALSRAERDEDLDAVPV